VTIFELNEKLKEDLVMNYGAWEAKSTLFNQGVVIIPEKFLETIVRWEKDADEELMKKGIDKILDFKDEITKKCTMTDIQYETSYGHPQILWALFEDDENFFEE
jgi:hypothetical protein